MPDVLLLIESAEPGLSRAMKSTLPFDSPLYLRNSFKKRKERKLLSVTAFNIEKLEKDFPGDPLVKNLPANAGDEGLIPGP